MKTKICSKCEKEKEVCLFIKDKRNIDGIGSYCKVCHNLRSSIWRKNKPNYLKDYYQNVISKNREQENIRNKIWRENNKDKSREFEKNKKNSNPFYKIIKNITSDLSKYIKISEIKKSNRTIKYIGCTPEELRKHLESQFTEGMSWDNYGIIGWHIDHKLPKSLIMCEEDIFIIFNYKNLQPLWYVDNIRKRNKIIN